MIPMCFPSFFLNALLNVTFVTNIRLISSATKGHIPRNEVQASLTKSDSDVLISSSIRHHATSILHGPKRVWECKDLVVTRIACPFPSLPTFKLCQLLSSQGTLWNMGQSWALKASGISKSWSPGCFTRLRSGYWWAQVCCTRQCHIWTSTNHIATLCLQARIS